MKAAGKISFGLNLAFFAALICIWFARGPAKKTFGPEPAPSPATPAPVAVNPDAPAVTQPDPRPFKWSQLESPDCRIYVKNLRTAGCPEATIRAIVTADLNAVYRQRSLELEEELDKLGKASWADQISSFNEQQKLKGQLQKLPGQEYAEICDLLGLKPATSEQPLTVDAIASVICCPQATEQDHVMMPLVLRPVDLAAMNMNDQQIQIISELRQQFIEDVGGPGQDPNDPAYRERWQKAQPEMDDNLRGMLGLTAFENYQLAAQDPPAPGN